MRDGVKHPLGEKAGVEGGLRTRRTHGLGRKLRDEDTEMHRVLSTRPLGCLSSALGQPRWIAAGNAAKLAGMVLLIPLGYSTFGVPAAGRASEPVAAPEASAHA